MSLVDMFALRPVCRD